MFERLPVCAYVVESGPQNKVVLFLVALLRVKNLFDLPLLRIIDNHCMWFRGWLSYDQRCVVIKLRHMEGVVIAHCFWQVEFVSLLIDDLT